MPGSRADPEEIPLTLTHQRAISPIQQPDGHNPQRVMFSQSSTSPTIYEEFWASTNIMFQTKLAYLLILGPFVVLGDATNLLPEAAAFCFAGLALVPLAERLSFVTEQVAAHTNGTFGALLNATFGNAPELLISVAALRSGYYRVVQLTMLGSMFTNMILVFGIACLIGGLRWHVQDVRITSGNVNVVMLLLATAGSLFPSALILTGQLPGRSSSGAKEQQKQLRSYDVPSREEVVFSRLNAAVMLILYLCYLVFQLGTHKDEFDEELHARNQPAKRNLFCRSYLDEARRMLGHGGSSVAGASLAPSTRHSHNRVSLPTLDPDEDLFVGDGLVNGDESSDRRHRRRRAPRSRSISSRENTSLSPACSPALTRKVKTIVDFASDVEEMDDDYDAESTSHHSHTSHHIHGIHLMSLRVGIVWLFVITLSVSVVTDVLVDTIDGFARRMNISEVFTSMVIIPFFSNVAEQVSAFIFAYRNEMDLVVGVTVGSAIQIATFVLPGSVLIGMVMDRSMTLFFRGYETVSLFFGVIVVGAILHGGTTNWLVGAILVGVYIIFAGGIWFHEVENLSVDAQLLISNTTNY